jgi:hypothetical protein
MALYIREAPTESPDWTVDEQLSLFFSAAKEGMQPVILLKGDDREQYFRSAIERTKGRHTPIVVVGKSAAEVAREYYKRDGTR